MWLAVALAKEPHHKVLGSINKKYYKSHLQQVSDIASFVAHSELPPTTLQKIHTPLYRPEGKPCNSLCIAPAMLCRPDCTTFNKCTFFSLIASVFNTFFHKVDCAFNLANSPASGWRVKWCLSSELYIQRSLPGLPPVCTFIEGEEGGLGLQCDQRGKAAASG